VHHVLSRELADQFVAALEDLGVFRVDRNQLVDPEESPVVDLVVGGAPVPTGNAAVEQLMQQVRVRLMCATVVNEWPATSASNVDGAAKGQEPQRI
jgi:hypothetical protein